MVMFFSLSAGGAVRSSKRADRGISGRSLLSSLGYGCLLLAFVERSTAFVSNAFVPGAIVRGCAGGGAACTASSLGSAGRRAAVAMDPREKRRVVARRKTQLGMEVIANNPITSKVYGRPDNKGKDSKTPDMNEEITASGGR